MKAVFSFKKEFEIDGHEFSVDMRAFKSDELMSVSKKFTEASNQADLNKITSVQTINLYKEAIDYILGSGAFDIIFSEKEATPRTCSNLFEFLMDELKNEFGLAKK